MRVCTEACPLETSSTKKKVLKRNPRLKEQKLGLLASAREKMLQLTVLGGWRLTGDIQEKTKTWRELLPLLMEGSCQPRHTDKSNPGSNTPNWFKSCSRIGVCWEGMFVSKTTQKRQRECGAVLEHYLYFKSCHV